MTHDRLIPALDPRIPTRPTPLVIPDQLKDLEPIRTSKKPTPARRDAWTPCASRARHQMISRGLTYERLAQDLQARGVRGASMAAIVRVIQGRTIVPYLREALAAYFHQPIEALWPEHRRVA